VSAVVRRFWVAAAVAGGVAVAVSVVAAMSGVAAIRWSDGSGAVPTVSASPPVPAVSPAASGPPRVIEARFAPFEVPARGLHVGEPITHYAHTMSATIWRGTLPQGLVERADAWGLQTTGVLLLHDVGWTPTLGLYRNVTEVSVRGRRGLAAETREHEKPSRRLLFWEQANGVWAEASLPDGTDLELISIAEAFTPFATPAPIHSPFRVAHLPDGFRLARIVERHPVTPGAEMIFWASLIPPGGSADTPIPAISIGLQRYDTRAAAEQECAQTRPDMLCRTPLPGPYALLIVDWEANLPEDEERRVADGLTFTDPADRTGWPPITDAFAGVPIA
jgi:hypothetical protein